MLNGHGHGGSRKDLVVNGRGQPSSSDGDTSSFYGDYEQRLASELSELLVAGTGTNRARPAAASGEGPSLQIEAGGMNRYSALSSTSLPRPSALQQAAPGAPRTVQPAVAAENDYAVADDDDYPPLPYSWLHEPRTPQPSWLKRQMRAGLLGLGAGLVVVLPAIAVISGRFDSWLPAERRPGTDRPAQIAAERPAAQRLSMATTQTPAPPPAANSEPVAVRTAIVSAPFVPQAMAAPVVNEPIPVHARSVITVEPFPPAVAPARSPQTSVTTRSVAVAEVNPPAAEIVAPRPVDEAANQLELGLTMVKKGDVSAARVPLTKAANAGNAEAMLALGETFDPNMLAAWAARNVKPDVSSAKLYYSRALTAGLTRAKTRLDALN